MTDTKPNADLAYRVLDHIDAHPEQWEQDIYIGKAECGTVACFAGWTVLLSGEKPFFGQHDTGTETSWLDHDGNRVHVPARAEELLRASRWAREGYDDEEDLFSGANNRADLGRLVGEIFGPRPQAAHAGAEDYR